MRGIGITTLKSTLLVALCLSIGKKLPPIVQITAFSMRQRTEKTAII